MILFAVRQKEKIQTCSFGMDDMSIIATIGNWTDTSSTLYQDRQTYLQTCMVARRVLTQPDPAPTSLGCQLLLLIIDIDPKRDKGWGLCTKKAHTIHDPCWGPCIIQSDTTAARHRPVAAHPQ